jgi:hypothetical protein
MKRLGLAAVALIIVAAMIGTDKDKSTAAQLEKANEPPKFAKELPPPKPAVTPAKNQPPAPPPKPAVGEEVTEAYFRHVWPPAASQCRTAVENAAKYDFEWTDGWLDLKFDSFNKGSAR